ncbi:MAG: IS66 family insertion sequence element accessory protein TnpB [Clostridiales Family XIII bacterium]|jgi:transposase-like protein|nr:IS66 family insertion sequence element accessory protein TnpB [Clostridiales Family XIII bacterium]
MQINKKCVYCGADLPESPQMYKRKYCSATCSNKFRLRLKKPDVQAKLWQHKPEVFEAAMEMHWSGYGGAAIARRFGVPAGTVYSWIHDFGEGRIRAEPEALPQIKRPAVRPSKARFNEAENADEWLCALREDMAAGEETLGDLPVRLVCGVLHGQSAGKLAAVIAEGLKENPMSGISYAFCSKCRNTVTVIAWKEPIFELSKYVKVCGTFTWPGENLGRTIEVAKAEFDRLLFIKKVHKKAKKNIGKR